VVITRATYRRGVFRHRVGLGPAFAFDRVG
jgi:hypothetical protein